MPHVFVCPSVRPSQTGVVTCIEAVELIGLVFRMYGFRLIYRTRRILVRKRFAYLQE